MDPPTGSPIPREYGFAGTVTERGGGSDDDAVDNVGVGLGMEAVVLAP